MTDMGDNGFEEGVEDSGPLNETSFQQSFSSGNGGIDIKRNRSRSRSPGRTHDDRRRDNRGARRDRDRGRNQPTGRPQFVIDQRTGKERRVNYDYCVFVSNIPYDVPWSELKTLMSNNVGPVNYVECFNDAEGKPSGCAFVEFKEKDAPQKSVEVMDKHDIRGRKLVVKLDYDGHHSSKFRRRKDQEMRAQQLLTPQLLQNLDLDPDFLTDTVFVANLYYKMDWRDVKDVFRVAGTVERVDIFKDKNEKSKGLAVIKYESIVDAVNAITMLNGRMLFGRELHVRMNRENQPDRTPKPKPVPIPHGLDSMGPSLEQIAQGLNQGPSGMGGNRMGGSMGMGDSGGLGGSPGGFGGMQGLGGGMSGGGLGGLGGGINTGGLGPVSSPLGMGAGTSQMGIGGLGAGMGVGGGLGMSNMNPGMSNMSNLGGNLGGLRGTSLSGGLGASSTMGTLGGLGTTDMGRSIGGSAGMGLDRLQSDITPRFSNIRDDFQRDLGQSRGTGNYGRREGFQQDLSYRDRDIDRGMVRDRGNRGGSISQSAGRDRDRNLRSSGGGNLAGTPKEGGCQIFVRNLPFSVEWHELKEAFKDIGHVMYADVKMDDQNRSKGYGTVRFERSEEAYRAISIMNGHNFKGRNLDVSLDRY